MTPQEFQSLQYGNVIADADGNTFIALHVTRDASGNAQHVGLLPALGIVASGTFSIVSKDHSETYLAGRMVFAKP